MGYIDTKRKSEQNIMIFKKKKVDRFHKASKLALENATLIHDEAKILLNRHHYARGFALSIISMEESAKAFLLHLISLDLVDENKTMNFVRNHDNKLLQSSRILSFVTKIASLLVDAIQTLDTETKNITPSEVESYKKNVKGWEEVFEKVDKFHKIKLDSFYVDVREGEIIDPNNMFKENPSEILKIADTQISIIKGLISLENTKFLEMWKDPFISQLKINDLLKN